MSATVMGLVLDSDVKPSEGRWVLLALANNANAGGYCYPGAAHIAGTTQTSRSSVFRMLKALEAADLIKRLHRTRANGSLTSNLYEINLELLRIRARKVSKEEEQDLAAVWRAMKAEQMAEEDASTGTVDPP